MMFRIKLLYIIAGAYNMGGSPAPTVEQIKNMVYMNQTGSQSYQSREEYLGEFYLYTCYNVTDIALLCNTA